MTLDCTQFTTSPDSIASPIPDEITLEEIDN
jgi:hypothetical protein